jgi:hypothetical protein
VAEQRYQAVLSLVSDGLSISQVAEKAARLLLDDPRARSRWSSSRRRQKTQVADYACQVHVRRCTIER